MLYLFPVWCLNFCSPANDHVSTVVPTHEIWDSLLQKHVGEGGLVDYLGFIRDRESLNRYLELLSDSKPNESWSGNEQLAFWINAYNAYTVQLILDHYPLESIKDIKRGIPFVNSVWDIKFIEIAGKKYDLNKIEHGILRKRFDEPRIHFAINCASMSCPVLLNEAFRPEVIDEQLHHAAINFLQDPSKNILEKDIVQISKIFSWFKGDFSSRGMRLIDFLNQYSVVEIEHNAKITYFRYDWTLNELKRN